MNFALDFIITKKYIKLIIVIFFAFLAIVLLKAPKAYAAYDGSRLIDNQIFLDANTMNASQIQQFLIDWGAGISSRSFILTCGAPSETASMQAYAAIGAPCGQTVPSSSIIYYASQVYGVNPRVILATMQKEQSLTTAPNPTDRQISQAMGYGCPTTGSCSSASNFFYQIDNGTWVLRYHYEHANGNVTWWSTASFTCGNATQFYSTGLYPGNTVTFKDEAGVPYRTLTISNAATSAFYCYTPHTYNNHRNGAPNSANPAGTLCYNDSIHPEYGSTGYCYTGSFNFVYWYEKWFGSSILPLAFKTYQSATVFIYKDGYKYAVPSMGLLQDYGVSPESIQTVTQTNADAIPFRPGNSQLLTHLIKTPSDTDLDGGSIYIVSVGKKYPLASMQQYLDFGFKDSDIAYLPMDYISSLPNGAGTLTSFLKTPASLVYKIDSAKKRAIFDYATYSSLNPTGSVTPVSGYFASLFVPGKPLANKELLVKFDNSSSIFLYANEKYYGIPSYDVYRCWGLDTINAFPLISVGSSGVIEPIVQLSNLGCTVTDGTSAIILNGINKYLLPAQFGNFNPLLLSTEQKTIINRIPFSAEPLKPAVKSSDSATVWYLENGTKKAIPSSSNFIKLGLVQNLFTKLDGGGLFSVLSGGIKLGQGQLVKSPDSSSVYVISGTERISFSSADDLNAYKGNWNELETYSSQLLDLYYPYNNKVISPYYYEPSTAKFYLFDNAACYLLDSTNLANFGKTGSSIIAGHTYEISLFSNLSTSRCISISNFIKSPNSGTVYWLDAGLKYPVSSWSVLVTKNGGIVPNISTINSETLTTLPTAPTIY